MKAKRYMKPPSCRKPATVIVPYAASPGRPETHQDNQRAAHLIGESGPKELEGDQRNNQPMSESGKKQKWRHFQNMSAVLPTTDIRRGERHVCFVP
jgi:hypothetical protein